MLYLVARQKISLTARRNLLHVRWGGYDRDDEIRRLGTHMIVDGDMPTRKFFISHGGTLLIGNLDPTLTKKDLSKVFQPYSTLCRDVEGSIEFVQCLDGLPTGQAYIGFDLPGDAEKALKNLTSKVKIGDRFSFIKLVKDRQAPDRPYAGPERRPDRSVDELLKDLNDWEQHVDPEDIKILEEGGVSKHVLDEALRAIRYNNETFGPLDHAVRGESLEPKKERGQQYRDIVSLEKGMYLCNML
jgi:RNA recognition motif-containing protein